MPKSGAATAERNGAGDHGLRPRSISIEDLLQRYVRHSRQLTALQTAALHALEVAEAKRRPSTTALAPAPSPAPAGAPEASKKQHASPSNQRSLLREAATPSAAGGSGEHAGNDGTEKSHLACSRRSKATTWM